MDFGLDNALANTPPFGMEAEACKRQLNTASNVEAEAECAEADPDNGVDHSDSDSEDLGPETAVDADDLDADARPRDPAPPTPPADAVEEGHVDGALLDNVAESGEESEDEWNYYKGEGDREEQNPSEGPDEPPRSGSPCQDNSAWETSSVDMNSSPLNPDAPVFVPGSVAGSDVLLAQSPRKPLPMDDIELPDVAQFETGAVVRPAELLDLDNCDHLNGHHNVSLEEVKEQLNGNNKYNMDSLDFGFSVGMEPEKETGLIQDFERIQKDTTDFCNIQVFPAHTETNPFVTEDNDELLERLKNKERDPMSMSFYQEKDDDTCERLSNKESHVDLNAVQPLPDSEDEEIQPNGVCENETENDKENISPEQHSDLLGMENYAPEPNNDIMRFEERKDILTNNATLNFGQGDNFMDYNVSSSNMQGYSNIEFEPSNVPQGAVVHTDTPESHKLLFEQIPEIPDGKSSELGFTTEDLLDQTESEKDARILTPQEEISQDIDMETRNGDSPCIEEQSHFLSKAEEDQNSEVLGDNKDDDIVPESELLEDNIGDSCSYRLPSSPLPVEDRLAEVISPEVTHNIENSVEVDVHQSSEQKLEFDDEEDIPQQDVIQDTPNIKIESEDIVTDAEVNKVCSLPSESPLPTESPLPSHSPLPSDTQLPVQSIASVDSVSVAESPIPVKSPLLSEDIAKSPVPAESPIPAQSPLPAESPAPASSVLPTESSHSLESTTSQLAASPEPVQHAQSPEPELIVEPPSEVVEPASSPAPSQSPFVIEEQRRSPSPGQTFVPSPLPVESPLPADVPLPRESPAPITPAQSPPPIAQSPPPIAQSPAPIQCSLPVESSIQREAPPMTEDSIESTVRLDALSPLDVEQAATSPASCPAPADVEAALQERLSPELAQEAFADEVSAGPAPDIVPDVPRSDLVTDIDIGIPESRAQEICMPVTSEIRHEDGATPPPTPATTAPVVDIPPVSETPIAADAAPALATAAVAATVAAAAAASAGAAKKTITKKSPTTPTAKPAPKTQARTSVAASPRTPASTTKPAALKSSSATKTAAMSPRPSPKAPAPAAAKAPAPRPAPKASAPAATARAALAAAKAPASKAPAPAKEAVTARAAPATTKAPAPRPAPKAAAPRPASAAPKATAKPAPAARPPAARPATAPAPRPTLARPRPADAKPKVAEKKPLANGDIKEAKPAGPRPAGAARPAARPAPRPTPRAPAPAPPSVPASAPTKTAAPKPAPRSAAGPGAARPLDKQTKDLANKRITAKAAPPRTAATKTAPGTKSVPVKVPKKTEAASKQVDQNGLTNGADAELSKPPPSPPAADNALLPDVIA